MYDKHRVLVSFSLSLYSVKYLSHSINFLWALCTSIETFVNINDRSEGSELLSNLSAIVLNCWLSICIYFSQFFSLSISSTICEPKGIDVALRKQATKSSFVSFLSLELTIVSITSYTKWIYACSAASRVELTKSRLSHNIFLFKVSIFEMFGIS